MEQSWFSLGFFDLPFPFCPYGKYRHGNDPPDLLLLDSSVHLACNVDSSIVRPSDTVFFSSPVSHLKKLEPFFDPFRQTVYSDEALFIAQHAGKKRGP